MNSLAVPGNKRSHDALIKAYADFYGQYETLQENSLEGSTLSDIARITGRACLELSEGQKRKAVGTFVWAQAALRQARKGLRPGDLDRTAARLMVHSVNILTGHEQPTHLKHERQALQATVAQELYAHIQTIDNLYAEPVRQNGVLRRQRGIVAELTGLGLVNRTNHLGTLSLGAFYHHDNGCERAHNYDNLVVEVTPDAAQCYPVQFKSACFGICDRPLPDPPVTLPELREQYDSRIRLISGHCDFGFPSYSLLEPEDEYFPLANLLIKETLGRPVPTEVRTLDEFSDRLLYAITSDESRRGLALPPQ